MASFTYRVRSTKKSTFAKIFVRFNVDKLTSFYADTHYLVLTDAWSDKTQGMKSRYAYTDEFTANMGRDLTNNLASLRSFILKAITEDAAGVDMTKLKLENIIHFFHHPKTVTVKKRESLISFIARYTKEMEDGTRLNNQKLRYGYSTIKNYKGFITQFVDFCKTQHKRFDFDDIDLKFYDSFVAYFSDRGYSVNTIGRHVKELKIIMRAAREEGLHANTNIESRKFKVLTTEVTDIYLSEAELKAISLVDLNGDRYKEIARDVFLVGCYTAQRYSDYSTIGEGNIRKLDSGQTVVDLIQRKTGNHVVIPARPELSELLKKYDNRLPVSHEQKVNKYIKEIARQAGITDAVEIAYIENGEKKRKIVEKCDLVKTHTARRSGATNMYLANIPSIAIMKITGHKTEKEFMKYIKISEEESAMGLMDHPYFNGNV